MPHLIAGKRRDEQFTVQTTLAKLREVLPPSHFTKHMELITDGKAVGEAIRMTGPDLVYVRFPDNASKHPVSFTLPRQFLIPVTCRPLARAQSVRLGSTLHSGESMTLSPSHPALAVSPPPPPLSTSHTTVFAGSPTYPPFGVSPCLGNIGGFSTGVGVAGHSMGLGHSHSMVMCLNNKDHHNHVDLGQALNPHGQPALCVVCGRWDETTGKKRRSGHKCQGCIGQKSLERLRHEFQRLLDSELNEEDDTELAGEELAT